ncbi:2-hydroxyacid dehydrogenase [Xenophilus azovorans]|uniref:2-hydroxyacid dehydrogenase n=1 Tax=Xenophilus azovorans TaxID=151755 RepID=UPI0005708F80|nr:2-hydroxyacid dehydrogenase [Xenophilus azovorans]
MTDKKIAETAPVPIPLLQLGPWLAEALQEALHPRFQLLPMWQQADPQAYLATHAAGVSGIITHTHGLDTTRALIGLLPRLEIVVNLGSGSESVDIAAVRERGIRFLNGAGANAPDVAELAISLMLAAGRNLVAGDRHVRAGRWPIERAPITRRVSGKRLGILGFGEIGRAIARRAAAFDMEIAYFARRPAEGVAWRYMPDLLELARWADFLVAALPGGAETHHIVDEHVLDALGPQGMLVNVGRGTVVDEAALVRALQQGRIAGAGLDVFEHEPHVPQALIESDKVVLQAHHGGSTFEAYQAVANRAAANLHAHFFPSRT